MIHFLTKPKEEHLKHDATRAGMGMQNRAGKNKQGVTQAKLTATNLRTEEGLKCRIKAGRVKSR